MTRALLVAAILLAPAAARAHPLAFGALVLREGSDGTVESTFRFSGTEARPVGARPVLPERCRPVGLGTTAELPDGGAVVRARFACGPRGLAGATVSVRGLEGTGVQIAVRVERADGSRARALLDDGTRALTLDDGASQRGVLARYVALGVEHIATGVDHLLFVLALLLLVRGRARLVATITAFTAGHSATLALAALSLVDAPRAAVEACIALSVLVVAHELARERTHGPSLTERAPWLVAGGFGLLHGLGFAGALSGAGLPSGAVVPALFGFNLGVELGQLAFVAVGLAAAALARSVRAARPLRELTVLGIGGAASYFLIDRLAALGA